MCTEYYVLPSALYESGEVGHACNPSTRGKVQPQLSRIGGQLGTLDTIYKQTNNSEKVCDQEASWGLHGSVLLSLQVVKSVTSSAQEFLTQ